MKSMTEETKAKIKASRENVKIHNITDKYRVVGRNEYLTLEKKVKVGTGILLATIRNFPMLLYQYQNT